MHFLQTHFEESIFSAKRLTYFAEMPSKVPEAVGVNTPPENIHEQKQAEIIDQSRKQEQILRNKVEAQSSYQSFLEIKKDADSKKESEETINERAGSLLDAMARNLAGAASARLPENYSEAQLIEVVFGKDSRGGLVKEWGLDEAGLYLFQRLGILAAVSLNLREEIPNVSSLNSSEQIQAVVKKFNLDLDDNQKEALTQLRMQEQGTPRGVTFDFAADAMKGLGEQMGRPGSVFGKAVGVLAGVWLVTGGLVNVVAPAIKESFGLVKDIWTNKLHPVEATKAIAARTKRWFGKDGAGNSNLLWMTKVGAYGLGGAAVAYGAINPRGFMGMVEDISSSSRKVGQDIAERWNEGTVAGDFMTPFNALDENAFSGNDKKILRDLLWSPDTRMSKELDFMNGIENDMQLSRIRERLERTPYEVFKKENKDTKLSQVQYENMRTTVLSRVEAISAYMDAVDRFADQIGMDRQRLGRGAFADILRDLYASDTTRKPLAATENFIDSAARSAGWIVDSALGGAKEAGDYVFSLNIFTDLGNSLDQSILGAYVRSVAGTQRQHGPVVSAAPSTPSPERATEFEGASIRITREQKQKLSNELYRLFQLVEKIHNPSTVG